MRPNWLGTFGGCKSWHLTEDGFNSTMYPGLATQFRAQMAAFENAGYRSIPARAVADSAAA